MAHMQVSGAHFPVAHPYDERYQQALRLAIYYQNRCYELTEILEMFCADADEATKDQHHD